MPISRGHLGPARAWKQQRDAATSRKVPSHADKPELEPTGLLLPRSRAAQTPYSSSKCREILENVTDGLPQTARVARAVGSRARSLWSDSVTWDHLCFPGSSRSCGPQLAQCRGRDPRIAVRCYALSPIEKRGRTVLPHVQLPYQRPALRGRIRILHQPLLLPALHQPHRRLREPTPLRRHRRAAPQQR